MCQARQRLVHGDDFLGRTGADQRGIGVEGYLVLTRAFVHRVIPGVVNEDAAHDLRRDAVEVRLALPRDGVLLGEFEKCLVDEGGGTQRVVLAFAAKVSLGECLEVAVDRSIELIDRVGGAVGCLGKQSSEL